MLLGILPCLALGYPWGDSSYLNLHWAHGFGQQIWSGVLYPRWLPDSFEGFGAPSFYFYPPLPFWWAALLRPLASVTTIPGAEMAVPQCALTLVAGVGCYLWLRDLTGSRRAAMIAAALYVVGPYQLGANFYIRNAYAEYTAAAILPYLFLAARCAALGSDRAALAVAAAYAALILAHLPTTLMASPFVCLAPFFFRSPRPLWRDCLGLWAGMAIGCGLAAIYLAPAMLEQALIHRENWTSPYFRYDRWFLFAGEILPPPPLQRFNEYLLVGYALLAGAAAALAGRRGNERAMTKAAAAALRFNLSLVAVGAFMTTAASIWVWRSLPPLALLQFPWRFLGIAELGLAGVLASAIVAIDATRRGRRTAGILAIGVLAAALAADLTAMRAGLSADPGTVQMLLRFASRHLDAWEYIPVQVPFTDADKRHVEERVAPLAVRDMTDLVRNVSGSSVLAVETWSPPRLIVLEGTVSEGARLEIRQFYFPTWQAAAIDHSGKRSEVPLTASAAGLVLLRPPAGTQVRLEIRSQPLASERLGEWLSAASLTLWLLAAGIVMGPARRRGTL